jgi:mannitol/fructose-specific phosphotransferase system IIA component (Ntr-type)
LRNILTKHIIQDRILLHFEAKGIEQAIEKMVLRSQRKNHATIITSLLKRESLMSTALGKGIALPRIILDDEIGTELIVAISRKGIDFNAFDRLPAKIIFLFLFSKTDTRSALLAQCLHMLNDGSIRTELLTAETTGEVIKLIKDWED